MANCRFTKRAEQDLNNIAIYTIQNFGLRQAQLYRDGLLKTLDTISEFPLIGSDQGHIKSKVRRFVYESHSIYYRLNENGIVILRLLGPGEDPIRHLT
jgi:toxin ParE1/3/4